MVGKRVSIRKRAQSPAYIENQDYILSKWDDKWGDRKNELVFIGQDMDKEQIIKDLDDCLLTDLEVGQMDAEIPFADDWPL